MERQAVEDLAQRRLVARSGGIALEGNLDAVLNLWRIDQDQHPGHLHPKHLHEALLDLPAAPRVQRVLPLQEGLDGPWRPTFLQRHRSCLGTHAKCRQLDLWQSKTYGFQLCVGTSLVIRNDARFPVERVGPQTAGPVLIDVQQTPVAAPCDGKLLRQVLDHFAGQDVFQDLFCTVKAGHRLADRVKEIENHRSQCQIAQVPIRAEVRLQFRTP